MPDNVRSFLRQDDAARRRCRLVFKADADLPADFRRIFCCARTPLLCAAGVADAISLEDFKPSSGDFHMICRSFPWLFLFGCSGLSVSGHYELMEATEGGLAIAYPLTVASEQEA